LLASTFTEDLVGTLAYFVIWLDVWLVGLFGAKETELHVGYIW